MNDLKTEEDNQKKIKEIDELLRITKDNDSNNTDDYNFKNPLNFYTDIQIMYYTSNKNKIIGHIYGKIINNIFSITDIKIRKKYERKGNATLLLNEYIKELLLKYKNIEQFELFSAGGKPSCLLYKNVFTKLGYILYDKFGKELNINCLDNELIEMYFRKKNKTKFCYS